MRITVKTRTQSDGTLDLRLATGIRESDVEATVEVHPAAGSTWPEGFFEQTFGAFAEHPIERSKLPAPNDGYTPEQRRMIDARLAAAEKGPYYGPFRNGSEIAAFLKGKQKHARSSRSKKSR